MYRYELHIPNGVSVLQKPYSPELNESGIEMISLHTTSIDEISQYPKMKLSGRIIKALEYSLKTKRNDSCIAFRVSSTDVEPSFGLVTKILVDKSKNCLLLIDSLEVLDQEYQLPTAPCGIRVSHIVAVKKRRCVNIIIY